jgi:hypothetical protein
MIEALISLWLRSAQPTPEEVEALRDAVPSAIDSTSALADHITAARIAGQIYDVDPYKLLAIAWHESGFKARTVTREPRHRVSCGPMTPVPKKRCSRNELTAAGGYMAGAEHYRAWLDACSGSEYCADLAYAGGSVTAAMCARGRRVLAPYSHHDVCKLHDDLVRRADVIRRALERPDGT